MYKKIRNLTLYLIIICTIFAAVFSAFIMHSLAVPVAIKSLETYEPPVATEVLDIKGRLIARFFAERREIITFNDLPPNLINAILATEDERFYSHYGFNPWRMAKAIMIDIIRMRAEQGGSTITIQLSKLLFLHHQKTVKRKIQELWYAIQIEKMYSKKEILEFYFNQIYFGHGCYGVEAAARYFFDKSAADMTLAECAVLAGLPKSPRNYSPIKEMKNSMRRHRTVLRSMVRQGYITREEANAAYQEFWVDYSAKVRSRQSTIADIEKNMAPYFIERIRDNLEKAFGKQRLYKEGFIVHTTLNIDHQRSAQTYLRETLARHNEKYAKSMKGIEQELNRKVDDRVHVLSQVMGLYKVDTGRTKVRKKVQDSLYQNVQRQMGSLGLVFGLDHLVDLSESSEVEEEFAIDEPVEGAFISIEPSTGYITAMVGGSGFGYRNQYDHVFQAKRQIGSIMKPFVYTAAIDSGKITSASIINDAPIIIPYGEDGEEYLPQNYTGEYYGKITAREALRKSVNVCAVKVLDMVGPEVVRDYSTNIFRVNDRQTIEEMFPDSYTMGLGSGSFSPYNICTAYSVFANDGKEVVPRTIRYVTDRNGEVIKNFEQHSIPRQLINPATAYILTSIMSDVLEPGGTAFHPNLLKDFKHKWHCSGKTGTTSNWTDSWFAGFNKYLCAVVWIGYDKQKSLGKGTSGGRMAAPIWIKFMKDALERENPLPFNRPNEVVDRRVCYESGMLEGPYCTKTYTEFFIRGRVPKKHCNHHDNDLSEQIRFNSLINNLKKDKSRNLKNMMELIKEQED